jgi:STE24 endopeptidase
MNEDKAARFHRLQRSCFWTALGIQTIGLLMLVADGWAQRLRDAALALTGGTSPSSIATVIVFTIMLLALLEILGAPERLYRTFILERRYGLSDIPLRLWVSDYAKGRALGAVLSLAASIAVYLAMAIAPERWWMLVAALGVLFLIVAARLLPSVFLPMFYVFKPLDRDSLRERIESLSRRANVPVLGIYEWGLGDKTRRANAALVGTGRGRRILLSDTLLSQYSDDEIEVILAHEMGHHAHRDIRNGLMLEAACIVLVCASAAVVLRGAWQPLGLESPADVAGLPLLLMTAGAVSLVTTPLMHAWSRRNEHRADRFALTMTERPDAFVSAMRRLAAQNLAEERPSTATLWLFHSHPPFEQRIQAARAFIS